MTSLLIFTEFYFIASTQSLLDSCSQNLFGSRFFMKKQKYENKYWTHICALHSRGNWTLPDVDPMKIFPKDKHTSKSKVILTYVSKYPL